MTTIAHLSEAMHTVLTTATAAAGAKLHYTRRPNQAKLTASAIVQTLVFGWLAHPAATLEQLAQMAAQVGVSVSPQAIAQRFTRTTATLLQQVLAATMQHLIASDPVAIPILQRFNGVRVHDGTTIVLPDALADQWRGCGGNTTANTAAALKCGVQLDVLTGTLTALDLVDGRSHDTMLPCQQQLLPKGSLRLADLGFYDLGHFAALDAAGVYWLSRVRPVARISLPGKLRVDLATFVEQHAALGYDGWVEVGTTKRVRARLLVYAVLQEVADGRRRRLRKEARDKGQPVSAAALALAGWTILMTNVPETMLSASEALSVTRVRWQIELLFKLWKSHGQIDQWRTGNAERVLCEVYAKLLAMVLQHWVLVVSCWTYADRSLVKAAQVVCDHAGALAGAQGDAPQLASVLETIHRVLMRCARMNRRAKQPNTYQRLLAGTNAPDGPDPF